MLMAMAFNAEEFVANVKCGKFDGRLIAELRKLSMDELEEVVEQIMRERSMMNANYRGDSTRNQVPDTA